MPNGATQAEINSLVSQLEKELNTLRVEITKIRDASVEGTQTIYGYLLCAYEALESACYLSRIERWAPAFILCRPSLEVVISAIYILQTKKTDLLIAKSTFERLKKIDTQLKKTDNKQLKDKLSDAQEYFFGILKENVRHPDIQEKVNHAIKYGKLNELGRVISYQKIFEESGFAFLYNDYKTLCDFVHADYFNISSRVTVQGEYMTNELKSNISVKKVQYFLTKLIECTQLAASASNECFQRYCDDKLHVLNTN